MEIAKQSGRGAFGEMVTWLRAHPDVRVILLEKTDRLYRNLKDWVTIDELDAEVYFQKEGIVPSRESRSSEKFMHGIKVLMAKTYIDNLSEEARKGQQEKARATHLADQDTARLPERHWSGRAQGHRRRTRGCADRFEAVRVVRDRRVPVERGGQEGARCWSGLQKERRAGSHQYRAACSHQYRAFDPAQSPLHRLVRVERQALSGQAQTAGFG